MATDVAHRDDLNGQLTTVLAAKAIIEAIRNASSGAILDQLAVTEPTSDGAEPVLPQ